MTMLFLGFSTKNFRSLKFTGLCWFTSFLILSIKAEDVGRRTSNNDEIVKFLSSLSNSKLQDLLSSLDEEGTTANPQLTKMPKSGKCSHHVLENKIIDVRTSMDKGAELLKDLETTSVSSCEAACCDNPKCDLYVFRTAKEDQNGQHCYIFRCGDRCEFSPDPHYISVHVGRQKPLEKSTDTTTTSTTTTTTTTTTTVSTTSAENEEKSTKANICLLPKEDGSCFGKFAMWFFDVDSHSCKPFSYSGCRGNANRFDTEEECKSKCGTVPVNKPIVKPYSECRKDDACSYYQGACSNGFCLCNTGYYIEKNACRKQCSEKEFKCLQAGVLNDEHVSCISESERCDGAKHCADGSDELGCKDESSESEESEPSKPLLDKTVDSGSTNDTSLGVESAHTVDTSPIRKANDSRGAVVALSLALGLTFVMLLFVGCRLRTVKTRLRKGRPKGHEDDYLINGMYL